MKFKNKGILLFGLLIVMVRSLNIPQFALLNDISSGDKQSIYTAVAPSNEYSPIISTRETSSFSADYFLSDYEYSAEFSSGPVCTDNDEVYCNNKGYCLSGECVCYDNLHYWTSDRCSTYHEGRELEDGMCCYPDAIDYYCSWLGKCDPTGSFCECFDNVHRTTSDRCFNWYVQIPDDGLTTCFIPTAVPTLKPSGPTPNPTGTPIRPTKVPTFEPTVKPSSNPSMSPTSSPSPRPTITPTPRPTSTPTANPTPTAYVCVPLNREYCNNRGYCDNDGTACVCDDVSHYWPSQRCEYYNEGRELEDGWFCYPDAVDYYCSWLGTCSSDGNTCECFDSVHRSSSDRCATYINVAPTPAPATAPSGSCTPADRGYCYNNGYCSDNGIDCVCDDQLHYWASEQCSTYHIGRELEKDDCCFPDTVDYYCSWLGTCSSNCTQCECFDSEHRLSSERCAIYHDDISTLEDSVSNNVCPDNPILISSSVDVSNDDSVGKSFPVQYIYIIVACGFVLLAALLLVAIMMHRKREVVTDNTLSDIANAQDDPRPQGSSVLIEIFDGIDKDANPEGLFQMDSPIPPQLQQIKESGNCFDNKGDATDREINVELSVGSINHNESALSSAELVSVRL